MSDLFDYVDHHGSSGSSQIGGGSTYLAEKLEQRRANSSRARRARHTDIGICTPLGADDDIFLNEAEEQARKERELMSNSISSLPGAQAVAAARGSTVTSRRSTMGVRIMDEKMDRLTKDNFALKMEVDQRRQHATRLQEQLDEMSAHFKRYERMQQEHTELWRINDVLVKELEMRDRAVEEAIDTICELEDKVAELEERRSTSSSARPATAQADSGYAGTETIELDLNGSPVKLAKAPRTPQLAQLRPNTAAAHAAGSRLLAVTGMQPPSRSRREPIALSMKKPSTQALRSVFLDNSKSLNGMKSFLSLLRERETVVDDAEEETLASPRLTVFSESSMPSVTGIEKRSRRKSQFDFVADDLAAQQASYDHTREASIKRVSQWIHGRDEPSLDERVLRKSSVASDLTERVLAAPTPSKRPGDDARYRAFADGLNIPSSMQMSSDLAPLTYSAPPKTRPARRARPTSLAGPIFGDSVFPPTPVSASTRMLRGSRSTMVEERPQLPRCNSTTPSGPAPLYQQDYRTAPKQMRSSVELNSAYKSYISRRNNEHAIDDDDIAIDTLVNPIAACDDTLTDIDTRSETVRDLSLDYDGFPDGKSIVLGTPSRFLKHGKPPLSSSFAPPVPPLPLSTSNNILFDKHDPPSEVTAQSPELVQSVRPQSSAGPSSMLVHSVGKSPRKPSFSRAETSPSYLGSTMGRLLRRMSNSTPRRRLKLVTNGIQ